MAKRFVLCIDGGGSYGSIVARVLAHLESSLGQDVRLKNVIDLFVGTSTGALICTALNTGSFLTGNRHGLLAEEIYDRYQQLIETVFEPNQNLDIEEKLFKLITGIYLDPRFTRKGMIDAFGEVFSENHTLGDYNSYLTTSLSNVVQKPLAIVSYKLNNQNPQNPLRIFKSWDSDDSDINLIEALVASSSVPSAHPPQKIGDKYHIDGGLLAEDPILPCLSCIFDIKNRELKIRNPSTNRNRRIFKQRDEIHILSFGTGYDEFKIDTSNFGDPFKDEGQIFWAKNIANVFLRGQHGINNTMRDLITIVTNIGNLKFKIHRFNFNVQPFLNNDNNRDDEDKIKRASEIDWNLLKKIAEAWKNQLAEDPEFLNVVNLLRESNLPN